MNMKRNYKQIKSTMCRSLLNKKWLVLANSCGVREIKCFGTCWKIFSFSIVCLFGWLVFLLKICLIHVQKSYSMPIGLDFQRRYATTVLDLEQLNKDLNKVLHEVQQFCYEVSEKKLCSIGTGVFAGVHC